MATPDMFGLNSAAVSAKAPTAGLLVTNHLNLMYMLAAGMVMPPEGFGEKYYADTLECFPGWIPLFLNSPSKEAIESVTKEAGHLKPAIVQIDLSRLSGRVVACSSEGMAELDFPSRFTGSERVILVPAPLPLSLIESINLRSADDKRACQSSAKDFANVPLEDFKVGSRKTTLFTKALSEPWPLAGGPPQRSVPLQQPLAAGGVMAMLLLFANLGDEAVRACRRAFDPEDDPTWPTEDHPILAGLNSWIGEGAVSLPAPPDAEKDRTGFQNASQARLFWDTVERVVAWQEAGRAGSPESMLIDFLDATVDTLDARLQTGVGKLRDTLVSLSGLADATANELFERHDTPLGHALTLWFLRREGTDLYDYVSDRLSELDWLAAAILFGVRDGWMRLPLRLRGGRALSDAVSHRMARLSHCIAGTGLGLGDAPPRVRPLRELFGDGSSWRASERSAALTLARAAHWDCVHTRISLGAGEYRLVVKAGSTFVEVPGEPRILPEVDLDRFFELLSSVRLDHATEAKVRKTLGG